MTTAKGERSNTNMGIGSFWGMSTLAIRIGSKNQTNPNSLSGPALQSPAMDQLLGMRVFARVAELGSFARAADALDMSRAMASSHVAQLEKHLGARLLHRTTRRVSVSTEGSVYLER